MVAKRIHAFSDCTGFFWRVPLEERLKLVSCHAHEVTCEACKQRIMQPLLTADWVNLPDLVQVALSWALQQIGKPTKKESLSSAGKDAVRAPRGTRSASRARSKVMAKGRIRWTCMVCHSDPTSSRFPGTNIRKDRHGTRYCLGCGSERHIKKIRV